MFPAYFSLAEILVLAGATGAGRMAPSASTRISARLQRVQEHSPRVNISTYRPVSDPDSCSNVLIEDYYYCAGHQVRHRRQVRSDPESHTR